MKKYLPFVLGLLLLAGLLYLVFTAKKPTPPLDERITLKEKDKVPYGFYVARNLLPGLFPGARIYSDNSPPGMWENIDPNGIGQVIFLIGRNFHPYQTDIEKFARFIRKGNYVFLITMNYSYIFRDAIGITSIAGSGTNSKDSFSVSLQPPRYSSRNYKYPGKKFNGYFAGIDTTRAITLGTDERAHPNFIQLKMGEGAMFIHLAPPAFSNYFILYKNNSEYFSKAISAVPATVSTVVWNEYYNTNRAKEKKPNWLGVLWKYPALRWALLTGLIAILLYLVLEMRRRQRYIPVLEKPKNDSLDFVQTIGRLYYDKKDHKDLAIKMSAYFLEHVREKYRVSTESLDEDFIKALHAKTGYPESKLNNIVEFIRYTRDSYMIKEQELGDFHEQLESFYKTT